MTIKTACGNVTMGLLSLSIPEVIYDGSVENDNNKWRKSCVVIADYVWLGAVKETVQKKRDEGYRPYHVSLRRGYWQVTCRYLLPSVRI